MAGRLQPLACALTALFWFGLCSAHGGQDPVQHSSAGEPGVTDARMPFDEWLEAVRAEALGRGIGKQTLETAFAGLQPLPVVVQRDRTQAEFSFTLDGYIRRRVTPPMVRDTRRAYARHRSLLRRVADHYGVPPGIVAAVWALESNLGRFSGVRPTIATLATMAWDGRRSEMFRRELFAALTILDRGDVELAALRGSWAGAMGQPQFMPSSYLRFAVDFDGDGRKDIWRSPSDVFASIANYLKENGWTGGQTWGREVKLPGDVSTINEAAPLRQEGCAAERGMTVPLPLAQWHDMGVTLVDGGRLPNASLTASLVRGETRNFLVYGNYGALLEYNCAHAYALSVALLADRLLGR